MRNRLLLLGLIGGAATLGVFAFPQKEKYSENGFGYSGRVDVKCGSVLDPATTVSFANSVEGMDYEGEVFNYGEPSIFEGETESQVCARVLKDTKTLGWAGGAVSALLVVIGFAQLAKFKPPVASTMSSPKVGDRLPPPPSPSPSPSPTRVPASPSTPAAPQGQPIPPPVPPPRPVRATTVETNSGLGPDAVQAGAPPLKQRVGGTGGIHDGMTVPRQAPVLAAPRVVERTVRFSDGSVRSFGGSIYIGRDPAPAGSGIAHQVSDPSVSKTHLRLTLTDGDVWVEDLHSTNGTSILTMAGERTLVPGQPAVVDVGSSVQFGDLSLRLESRP